MRSIKRQTTDNLNIDWHAFYRNVFALIIPMALQNLINVGVTAVDVMMLGRVGEKVLSGSSLAGQIQFIMMLIRELLRKKRQVLKHMVKVQKLMEIHLTQVMIQPLRIKIR